jgi:hypothetical protein
VWYISLFISSCAVGACCAYLRFKVWALIPATVFFWTCALIDGLVLGPDPRMTAAVIVFGTVLLDAFYLVGLFLITRPGRGFLRRHELAHFR